MALGEEIKRAREEKNLSQEDLAEQLGVSRQAVSKWENGMALPQGINREMLDKILELNMIRESEETDGPSERKKKAVIWKIGWLLAAVMTIISLLLIMALAGPTREQTDDTEDPMAEGSPALKTVRFYDKDENIVEAEALWYNAARIELILLQWKGGTPNSVRVFRIPSGSETMEQMELLLTKSILDGDDFVLLDAEILKDIGMSHLFFELDFGTNIVTSEEYDIFYDEELLNAERN
ncbi:MAG: helix-turn-helix domain-containing protein [Bacteroidales bacterium]|nr:helix-turn-helix domain-containing protein [Lachnoclostridium sp.]MCM1384398.1 helix-turn-helix domain-containing protein [Lachnoclostridium sp.]MCM1465178.1 helix-turn-helix domain-containing protein [Bacteroidales bacterium]